MVSEKMVSESGEVRRQGRSCDHLGLQPPVQENLPCPRCQSTSTKFCYYNNYNMSQPRYLCKDCRRYWTHGGTLRNIPVGGATRKTPAAKRPRTTSPTTSATSSSSFIHDPTTSDSLLNLNQTGFSGLLQLGGYGYGYDEMGYGLVRGVNGPIWTFPEMGGNGSVDGESAMVGGGRSMVFPMSSHIADGGGWSSAAAAEVECYGWPELAISMSGNNGLK